MTSDGGDMDNDIEMPTDADVIGAAWSLLQALELAKPQDRSDKARLYAVAITDAQKLYAFLYGWLVAIPGAENIGEVRP